MKSKLSPNPRRTEDAAWFISADTRQDAREADACIATDDWLYAAPEPPRAKPRPLISIASPRTPAR